MAPSPLTVSRKGSGSPVVLLASLGRSTSDFDGLAAALVAAGHSAVAVEGHGVGASALPAPGADLHRLAADVAAAVCRLGAPVVVVGHAFGSRAARCLAADRPGLVAELVLLGCGGKTPADPEARAALWRCFDADLSAEEHLRSVATAFFAPGNDPGVWKDGWWPEAARAQSEAGAATPPDDWWLPPPPIPVWALVGAEDRISPPANARALVDQLQGRGVLEVLPGAGHALVPERPDAVLEVVLEACRRCYP